MFFAKWQSNKGLPLLKVIDWSPQFTVLSGKQLQKPSWNRSVRNRKINHIYNICHITRNHINNSVIRLNMCPIEGKKDKIPLEALKFLIPNMSAYSRAFWRTTFELSWRPSASASSNSSEIFCSISGKAELRFLKAWLILLPRGELAGDGWWDVTIWFDLNMSTICDTFDGHPATELVGNCCVVGDGGSGVNGSPKMNVYEKLNKRILTTYLSLWRSLGC